MTFTRALESVRKLSVVDYVMVDIKCCLKVVLKVAEVNFLLMMIALMRLLNKKGFNKVLVKYCFLRYFVCVL